MPDILALSRERRAAAWKLLGELDLINLWSAFGRPVVVGALAYDLMWAPDIDLEVYCPEIGIEDGFRVLSRAALHPGVRETTFMNFLDGPDRALYWRIRVVDVQGLEWKVDMWSAPEVYDLPRGEHMVEPMNRALTSGLQETILGLKALMQEKPELAAPSIHLYRAVMAHGVKDEASWRAWREKNDLEALTDWRP